MKYVYWGGLGIFLEVGDLLGYKGTYRETASLKRFVSTWTFIFVVDEGRIENFTSKIVFTPSGCLGCDLVAKGKREIVKAGSTNNKSFDS